MILFVIILLGADYMIYTTIGTLTLNNFIYDKNNLENLHFLRKLTNDEDVKKRIQGLSNILSNKDNSFFGQGFIVKDNNIYVGYVHIGNFNKNEKCVYLIAAIDKDLRGKSYGKILLNEITEYIFKNYPEITNIRLKIDKDNIPSLKVADACGYKWLENEFYKKDNPYILEEQKQTLK